MFRVMQPETGGRFSLELCAHDDALARYALTLAIPGAEWSAEAVITIGEGGVEFAEWKGEGRPPGWLLQYARATLRSTWRSHAEQGWPRRLTRWRDEPDRHQGAGGEGSAEGSSNAGASSAAASDAASNSASNAASRAANTSRDDD